jgi:DNA-binding response OmpR family regulator
MEKNSNKGRILWADDEIELLRPHKIFLEQRGYEVFTVTNGADAVEIVKSKDFDIVLLDEMMPGLDGLQTLAQLKSIRPSLPAIMITKNEEESLMEEAIGEQISDYLTKPVNPSQIISAIKRILDKTRIRQNAVSEKYINAFNELNLQIGNDVSAKDWIKIHHQLSNWELDIEDFPELGFQDMLQQQKKDADLEFSRFIRSKYEKWVNGPYDQRPIMAPDVIRKFVKPLLENDKKVLFIVMDCMRWDQWLTIEKLLFPEFQIRRDGQYTILPTTTEYSRNAMFSGLFPDDIASQHPDWWHNIDENSLNAHEGDLLKEQMKRLGLHQKPGPKYKKIYNNSEGDHFTKNFKSIANHDLIALVVNQIDLLTHHRTDSSILQDLIPNETSYREMVRTWFKNSWIFNLLLEAKKYNYTIVVTSDHGSIKVEHSSVIKADRDASVNLRFKLGRNLQPNPKDAWLFSDPSRIRIPVNNNNETIAIALKDYYFLYPNNFRKYQTKYEDTYQHGGLSLWEMITPVATLTSK